MENNIKILVAEDSPTQALKVQEFLEKNNFDVILAKNGKEAVDLIQKEKPQILISDVIMPEMSGYELCAWVRKTEEFKNLPIILLTSLSDPENIIKGLEAGADNFVTKPYSEKFLLSRIHYIVSNLEFRTAAETEMGLDIFFSGKKHHITSSRLQILDLLFSAFENAVEKNRELQQTNKELQEALDTVKTLKGLVPICANCKKIRNDDGYWQQVESYVMEHTEAEFSHGICPDCMKKLYPEYYDKLYGNAKNEDRG